MRGAWLTWVDDGRFDIASAALKCADIGSIPYRTLSAAADLRTYSRGGMRAQVKDVRHRLNRALSSVLTFGDESLFHLGLRHLRDHGVGGSC